MLEAQTASITEKPESQPFFAGYFAEKARMAALVQRERAAAVNTITHFINKAGTIPSESGLRDAFADGFDGFTLARLRTAGAIPLPPGSRLI